MTTRTTEPTRQEDDDLGREASRPRHIPASGWKDVLLRTKNEIKDDRVPMVAAAMSFYALLALFPGLVAVVSIYALVSDPAQVERQMTTLTALLPASASDLLSSYLGTATTRADGTLGWGAVIGIIGALWSASGGTAALIKATNIAYDEDETRGFFKLRGLALLLTLAFSAAVVVAVALVAVLPALVGRFGLSSAVESLIGVGRWPLLAVGMIGALAVLYRYSPDRDPPRWRWATWGSVAATTGWMVASLLFSLYVTHFGSFGQTYGPIAGVIVLMLWLFVTSFMVLTGAELNSEIEAQTRKDTTVGRPKPMGERDAQKADHLGGHVADAR